MGAVIRAAVVAAVVAASPVDARADERMTADRLLGWRISLGGQPLDRGDRFWGGIGLELGTRWRGPSGPRLAAEYDAAILVGDDRHGDQARGTAHRLGVAVRRSLADAMAVGDQVRFYADAELGVGAAWVHDSAAGRGIRPDVVVGIRLGYELLARRPSPSLRLDDSLAVRLTASPDGIGFGIAVGMAWGD